MNYELDVNFKLCELNFELVHLESALSQHWILLALLIVSDGF